MSLKKGRGRSYLENLCVQLQVELTLAAASPGVRVGLVPQPTAEPVSAAKIGRLAQVGAQIIAHVKGAGKENDVLAGFLYDDVVRYSGIAEDPRGDEVVLVA